MTQSVGKIFWVNDDFNYSTSQTSDYEHTAAKIECAIIDENIIFLSVPNTGYLDRDYSVNLIRKDTGTEYTNHTGDISITCEKFENEDNYLLQGTWVEETITYTWWAKIKKDALK